MHRLACAAALAGLIVAIAGPACAQLPMSPALRESQPAKASPAAKDPPAAKAPAATSPAAATKGEADPAVVASAPVPPPPPPVGGPATPSAASPPPPPAAKTVAAASSVKRHASQRRPVYPRYRTAYSAAGVWGFGGSWHYGPNPYSPNGGY